MSQVDFHILPDDQATSLQHFACKLAANSWRAGQRVLIQTDSMEDSQQLDQQLWDITPESFIPHGIVTLEEVDQRQPILIAHQPVALDCFQHIINLSSRLCDIDGEDLQIDEILNQNEQRKQTGRQHYKQYRELGYALQHHTLEPENVG